MKNIIKSLIVMLSSVSLFASANAGELGVSGTAKATYNILSGKTNKGKGLGVTNELNFTATGETDAGYTWSYSMELDPNAVSSGTTITLDSTSMGRNATEMRVDAAPIDGLKIGASHFTFDEQGGATKLDQEAESGAYYFTYASGPFSVGYSKAYRAEQLANAAYQTATNVDYYDQTNYSVAFAASDDLSVSYERETSEANYIGSGTAAVEQESSAVQVAYTMGGMTIALSHASHDNNGYSTTNNQDQSLIAVTMAF